MRSTTGFANVARLMGLFFLFACGQTSSDEVGGSSGAGGAPAGHVNDPSCYRGNILVRTIDCFLPAGYPVTAYQCPQVVDADNSFIFSFCDTAPDAPFNIDCGQGCRADRCCYQDRRGPLFCADAKVCKEGLAQGADNFAYTDFTKYTGEDIPDPPSCGDTITKIGTCAPGCGQCTEDEICSGRSPTHPLGICFPSDPSKIFICNNKKTFCLPNELCLLLEHPRPELADDDIGTCIAADACLQLAASLPGGAQCHDMAGNTVEP